MTSTPAKYPLPTTFPVYVTLRDDERVWLIPTEANFDQLAWTDGDRIVSVHDTFEAAEQALEQAR